MNVPSVHSEFVAFPVGDTFCVSFIIIWNERIPDVDLPTTGVRFMQGNPKSDGAFGSIFIAAGRGVSWRPRRQSLGDPGKQPIRQAISKHFWEVQGQNGKKCAEPAPNPMKLRLPRIEKYDPMVQPFTISFSDDGFQTFVYSDVSSVFGIYEGTGLRGTTINFVSCNCAKTVRGYETFVIGDCPGNIIAEPHLRIPWGFTLEVEVGDTAAQTEAQIFDLENIDSPPVQQHPSLAVLDDPGGAVDNGRLLEDRGSTRFTEITCP